MYMTDSKHQNYFEIFNDVKLTFYKKNEKIVRYTEMFIDYIDNENFEKLYNTIKNNEIPSDELLKNILNDSEKDQKLFQWIEVLVREF